MLKFYASPFVKIMQTVTSAEAAIQLFHDDDTASSETFTKNFEAPLTTLGKMLRILEMPLSLKTTERLLALVDEDQPVSKGKMAALLAELHGRVHDELDARFLFSVDRHGEYLEDGAAPFGDDVPTKFPSTRYDIEEAGKCLALRRATACVMHLMRAMEVVLNGLAAKFAVPFANTNWATVLDQIDAKIKAMSSVTHGAGWKDDQQFYSEAAVYLRLVKDAWRNHAMHVKVVYTEDKSEEIFQAAKSLMRHLSTRLSE